MRHGQWRGMITAVEPVNTIVMRWADLGDVELCARSVDGAQTAVAHVAGGRLFEGMRAGPALRGLYGQMAAPASQVVPLFWLRGGDGGVHVYSQIRFLGEDACFIRLTERRLDQGAVEDLGWLAGAVELHAANATFLNNHQCYYRKCFPGQELEYKYTLDPSSCLGNDRDPVRAAAGGWA